MDADTRDLLAKSLRHVLTEDSDRPLADRLADLGWDEVVADDASAARRTLFETKGEVLASADVLGPLLADAIGEPAGTVVLPVSLHPDRRSSTLTGRALAVDGVALSAPTKNAPLVVPVAGDVLVVNHGGAGIDIEAADGIDPDFGLHRVRGEVEASGARSVASSWDAALALGRWALAAELVGIGRVVVEDAVAYTKDRHQYGRPIGSFQALQHRLATAHASLVGASDVVAEAAISGSPWVALVAKALAGHAVEDCCTQAQQSYGAIGFTWEHGFHRALRRTYLLDRLLGGWRELEPEIGRELLATRDVPKIGSFE